MTAKVGSDWDDVTAKLRAVRISNAGPCNAGGKDDFKLKTCPVWVTIPNPRNLGRFCRAWVVQLFKDEMAAVAK
jgi:hypothetical protein